MVARRLAFALFLAVTPLAVPAHAGSQKVRVEKTLEDNYFDVWGTTADEVFDSIRKKGLGGVPGRAASGVTKANLSASMQISSSPDGGPCSIESLALTLKLDVTLPRHGRPGSLDKATRENWEVYATGVEAHEYEHVGIEEQGMRDVATQLERLMEDPTLPGPGPEGCRRIVDELLAAQRKVTDQRHETFHQQEARWLRDSQLEVRNEIQGMDRRIGEHAQELHTIDQNLNALGAQLAVLEGELQALAAEWGQARMSPEARADATALQGAIADVQSQIALQSERRATTVEEHERLLEARKQRADDLSWIR